MAVFLPRSRNVITCAWKIDVLIHAFCQMCFWRLQLNLHQSNARVNCFAYRVRELEATSRYRLLLLRIVTSYQKLSFNFDLHRKCSSGKLALCLRPFRPVSISEQEDFHEHFHSVLLANYLEVENSPVTVSIDITFFPCFCSVNSRLETNSMVSHVLRSVVSSVSHLQIAVFME